MVNRFVPGHLYVVSFGGFEPYYLLKDQSKEKYLSSELTGQHIGYLKEGKVLLYLKRIIEIRTFGLVWLPVFLINGRIVTTFSNIVTIKKIVNEVQY